MQSGPRQIAIAAAGMAMQRYQRSTQAFDDAVGRGLGFGPADMRCLDHLAERPLTAGELATATGLRPAATTALIDRLAARGVVERRPHPTDRRRIDVALTDVGARMIGAAYGPLVQEGAAVFDGMTATEVEGLRALLERMTELTDRHRLRVAEGVPGTPVLGQRPPKTPS